MNKGIKLLIRLNIIMMMLMLIGSIIDFIRKDYSMASLRMADVAIYSQLNLLLLGRNK